MEKCLERIFNLLSEKGVTNRNLAEYLDIPPTVISDWKRGSTSYLKYVAELSDYFGVSADFILCRTPVRRGTKWDELIKQYQLCDDAKQSLVNRLLAIAPTNGESDMYCKKLDVEEDMSLILELISIFDKLTLIEKSRLLTIAADTLSKTKTTL